MGRYLDLARQARQETPAGHTQPARCAGQSSRASHGTVPYSFDFEDRFDDPFWQAADYAWKRFASHQCFPGMMGWLQRVAPEKHRQFTKKHPAMVDFLWDAGDLEGFLCELERWVALHAEACSLYAKSSGKVGGAGQISRSVGP